MPTSTTPPPDRGFDLAHFGLREMLRCGGDVRALARSATSVEAAAQAITRHLYDHLRTPDGARRACALVRCFVTRPLASLDPDLRAAAVGAAGGAALPADVNCLVLLATVGDEAAWCDRRSSVGHQVIPLSSADAVRGAPMIARLIDAFGVPVEDLVGAVDPARLIRATAGKTYGVFHVAEAATSPYIPAQRDFVARHGIASVLGFGAALRTGDVAAVIMFSRTPIPADSADRFRTVALDLKSSLHRFGAAEVFATPDAPVAH